MSRAFDICGPLPQGITVLEASAGTGKTFTIAALATRYVAEGVPLERLLLVTFTRILGRVVRQWHVLTLEEAVKKMTSQPANRLGIADPMGD